MPPPSPPPSPESGRANFVDAFEGVTSVYLVMELLKGGAVKVTPTPGVQRKDEQWERHVTHVVRNVLRFLAGCHAKGIIYRDVKPVRPRAACPWAAPPCGMALRAPSPRILAPHPRRNSALSAWPPAPRLPAPRPTL